MYEEKIIEQVVFYIDEYEQHKKCKIRMDVFYTDGFFRIFYIPYDGYSFDLSCVPIRIFNFINDECQSYREFTSSEFLDYSWLTFRRKV